MDRQPTSNVRDDDKSNVRDEDKQSDVRVAGSGRDRERPATGTERTEDPATGQAGTNDDRVGTGPGPRPGAAGTAAGSPAETAAGRMTEKTAPENTAAGPAVTTTGTGTGTGTESTHTKPTHTESTHAKSTGTPTHTKTTDTKATDTKATETEAAKPSDGRPGTGAKEHLVEPADTNRFQERWREIQADFVDDPKAAVRKADEMVGELLDVLTARRRTLDQRWHGDESRSDTERLRLTLHGYRDIVTRILAG